MMKAHFVTFLSPGTFTAESTTKEIPSWDEDLALEMSGSIQERHGSTPYGFFFTTRQRGEKDLDSRETSRSGVYYLNAQLISAEEAERIGEKVLASNIRANGLGHAVCAGTSYKFYQPFLEGDVILTEAA